MGRTENVLHGPAVAVRWESGGAHRIPRTDGLHTQQQPSRAAGCPIVRSHHPRPLGGPGRMPGLGVTRRWPEVAGRRGTAMCPGGLLADGPSDAGDGRDGGEAGRDGGEAGRDAGGDAQHGWLLRAPRVGGEEEQAGTGGQRWQTRRGGAPSTGMLRTAAANMMSGVVWA